MKKILFILLAIFVFNAVYSQDTRTRKELQRAKYKVESKMAVTDSMEYQGSEVLTTETGVPKDSLSTIPESKAIVLGWVGNGTMTNAINNTFQDSVIGGTLNGEIMGVSSTQSFVAGYYKTFAVYSESNATCVGFKMNFSVAGSYTISGNNYAKLFSYVGGDAIEIATTGNDPDLWNTGTGWQAIYFETPVELSDSIYYISVLCNYDDVLPIYLKSTITEFSGKINNVSLSAASGNNQTLIPSTITLDGAGVSTTYPYAKLIGY